MQKILCDDNNIEKIREKYPCGLHFVVGDTHGEYQTLMSLMDKICFDPTKDSVFFVGDYNAGGDPHCLLEYISRYYEEEYDKCGFHLIRGNHELELCPQYPLSDLPDIFVLQFSNIRFFIAHAGMIRSVFDIICRDISQSPDVFCHAYRLARCTTEYDAPFRQVVWSRFGLYFKSVCNTVWPESYKLADNKACIIHGHTPYSFMTDGERSSYGGKNAFWVKQHILFSEDLQSFDIDSNIKGRFDRTAFTYRGISCLCLEVYNDMAKNGILTIDNIQNGDNAVFAAEYVRNNVRCNGDINRILCAKPKAKTISVDNTNKPVFID